MQRTRVRQEKRCSRSTVLSATLMAGISSIRNSTLHEKDLKAHGITNASQIVGKMRNPGPGMTKFDKKTISDKDANKIAKYLLKTFK